MTRRAVSELRYRRFWVFAIVFGLMIRLGAEGWLLARAAFRLRHCWQKLAGIALAALLSLTAGSVSGSLWYERRYLPRPKSRFRGSASLTGSDESDRDETVQISNDDGNGSRHKHLLHPTLIASLDTPSQIDTKRIPVELSSYNAVDTPRQSAETTP